MTVFDIDGVLADVRHRLHHIQNRPKDWDGFFNAAPSDPVLEEGRQALLAAALESQIVYVTGRPERCRQDTLTWLESHGLPVGRLLMRPDTDRRPARFYKAEVVAQLSDTDEVLRFVDDDAAVVQHLRDMGVAVVHATWMDESEQQLDLLEQAQETDGRT